MGASRLRRALGPAKAIRPCDLVIERRARRRLPLDRQRRLLCAFIGRTFAIAEGHSRRGVTAAKRRRRPDRGALRHVAHGGGRVRSRRANGDGGGRSACWWRRTDAAHIRNQMRDRTEPVRGFLRHGHAEQLRGHPPASAFGDERGRHRCLRSRDFRRRPARTVSIHARGTEHAAPAIGSSAFAPGWRCRFRPGWRQGGSE